MKVVKGNKIIDIDKIVLTNLTNKFERIIVDLGTGDGRLVYKSALENPTTLFIGIEPATKQMDEFSRKAMRKRLDNLLYVVGSIELLPQELENIADELKIILPWGTLLKAIAEPTEDSINKINFLLKKNAKIEMIFGYDSESEPTETTRLGLKEISKEKIETQILPIFESFGYKKLDLKTLGQIELKELESTWGKRISQRDNRPMFLLRLEK